MPLLGARVKDRCIDTRLQPNGLKYRRYRREDGTTYKTIEAPIELWKAIETYTTRDRIGSWFRARERRALRDRACHLRCDGWKPIAIASELGVPERTVQRWVSRG